MAEFQKRASELQQRQNSGEELSEQDLEAVAGGATPLTRIPITYITPGHPRIKPNPNW